MVSDVVAATARLELISGFVLCRHLKWRVMDHWRRLQAILKIEKETEARRERWRHKIYELLPDYTPNRDDYV